MKIFLSYPMHGYSKEEQEKFKSELIAMFEDTSDITFVDNSDCEAPENAPRLYCLGEAIKKLGECDAIALHYNWVQAAGCTAERSVAKAYGMKIFVEYSPRSIMWAVVRKALDYDKKESRHERTLINNKIMTLIENRVESLEQLCSMTKEDIIKLRGFDPVSSVEICDAIEKINAEYSEYIGKFYYRIERGNRRFDVEFV